MRTRPSYRRNRGSDDMLSKMASATDFLPFMPAPSWYEAYWYQDRPARRERNIAGSTSHLLFGHFIGEWLKAVSRIRVAPVARRSALSDLGLMTSSLWSFPETQTRKREEIDG